MDLVVRWGGGRLRYTREEVEIIKEGPLAYSSSGSGAVGGKADGGAANWAN